MGEVVLDLPEEDQYTYPRRRGVPLLAVRYVYVHPLCRGRGWAKDLMNKVCAWADKAGVDLQLYVSPYGSGAKLTGLQLVEFYRQFKFRDRAGPVDYHSVYMIRRCSNGKKA